jgi:hypothetical protein
MSIKEGKGILMKQLKSLFYMSVITSFLIMMCLGTVYANTVTMQREGTAQKGRESTVSNNSANVDGNQLKFAPQRLKNKNDSDRESETGNRPVSMQRYKPSAEGEGESKIK